jgi:hypothetical protein
VNQLGVPLPEDDVGWLDQFEPEVAFAPARHPELSDAERRGAVDRMREIQRNGRITGEEWRGAILDSDGWKLGESPYSPVPGDYHPDPRWRPGDGGRGQTRNPLPPDGGWPHSGSGGG